MIFAENPPAEAGRLQTLSEYGILDTEPVPAFDRLTRLGSRVFSAPIVLVSLVDENRQWFKSCYGLAASETDRDISFCSHTILTDEPLVILNALDDVRFSDNPFVKGELGIRFYAGAPLIAPSGARIGSFCVIDREPRAEFGPDQIDMLRDFAAITVEELELRRTAHSLLQAQSQL